MSIYNDDELEAPSWLNKEFMQNILRNYKNEDSLELNNITITPATLKGDHFASCMFRTKIEYHTVRCKEIVSCSFIIKVFPEIETLKGQMLSGSKIFETEISLYTQALPKIEQILAEYGDNTRFGPNVVYTSLDPMKILIFEDLCEYGYDIVRDRCLEFDELKKVMLKIAKFHAASYKISKSKDAEFVTKYQDGLFNSPKIYENEFMSGGINRFKELLKTNDELKEYLPRFESIADHIKQDCIDLYNAYKNPSEDDIFVLNHGDFHLRNLMFKFNNENEYENFMMVDFQLSVFGPPVIDVIYATYMVFSPEQRLEKYDEILRFYFENFIASLEKIEYKGELPSFEQFLKLQHKYRRFAIYMVCTFLPMMVWKPENMVDVDPAEILNSNDKLMITYHTPSFTEELKRILPDLLKRGYLD